MRYEHYNFLDLFIPAYSYQHCIQCKSSLQEACLLQYSFHDLPSLHYLLCLLLHCTPRCPMGSRYLLCNFLVILSHRLLFRLWSFRRTSDTGLSWSSSAILSSPWSLRNWLSTISRFGIRGASIERGWIQSNQKWVSRDNFWGRF